MEKLVTQVKQKKETILFKIYLWFQQFKQNN